MDQSFLEETSTDEQLDAIWKEASRPASRLDEIRDLSNITQALENLLVQCDGRARFEPLQEIARELLESTRRDLNAAIHGPS